MPPSIVVKSLENYLLEEINRRVELLKVEDLENSPLIYAPARVLDIRRNELACLDEILRKERLRYAEKQREFNDRWKAASKQLQNVDETISLISKPYIEKKFEITRVTSLAQRQSELQAEKIKEVRRLLKEKCYLKQVLKETIERVDKYKIVESYLSKVVDSSHGEFKSSRELIQRANLLIETRQQFLDRNQRIENLIIKKEKELEHSNLVSNNSACLLNNLIADLTDDLMNAKEVSRSLESDVAHVKATAANRTKILAQVKIGTYNIYEQICHTFGKASQIGVTDTVKQLEYIKNSMVEINKIRVSVTAMLTKLLEERQRVALEEEKHLRAYGRWHKTYANVKIKTLKTKEDKIRDIFGIKPHVSELGANMRLQSVTNMMKKYAQRADRKNQRKNQTDNETDEPSAGS